jgi:hypothetical protein
MNTPRTNPACPCFGYFTLDEQSPGAFLIFPVCFWEDDPVQFRDRDCAGGADRVSLKEAQENFRVFGASERQLLRYVRPPLPAEVP